MLAYAEIASDAARGALHPACLPSAGDKTLPRTGRRRCRDLTNNHLQYALTWFALAAVLAVMAGLADPQRCGSEPMLEWPGPRQPLEQRRPAGACIRNSPTCVTFRPAAKPRSSVSRMCC